MTGQQVAVYPGALPSVIDVASTSNSDIQSVYTNYGAPPVWMAAPGEGVMTTYPRGTYAAGWGTSFSAPFVSGTAALMLGGNGNCTSSNVAAGLAHAASISDPPIGIRTTGHVPGRASVPLMNEPGCTGGNDDRWLAIDMVGPRRSAQHVT
jgi:subtilisin family serine protease